MGSPIQPEMSRTGDDAVGGGDAAAVNRIENISSGSEASTFWNDSTFALVYIFHSDSTGRRGGGGGYGLDIRDRHTFIVEI